MSDILKLNTNKYRILIEQHNKLSKAIKKVELIVTTAPLFPVINETRYALRAIIDMLTLDFDKKTEGYDEAFHRCEKALLFGYNDLLDCSFTMIKIYISEKIDEYGLDIVLDSFGKDNYKDLTTLITTLEDKIVLSRGEDRTPNEYDNGRYAVYEDMINAPEYLSKLLDLYKKLDDSLPLAVDLRKERKKKSISSKVFQVGLVIVGLVIGAILNNFS